MAVADKTPGTQKDEQAEAPAGSQQPTPTTITIPATPSLPSLNQLMEPKRLMWLGGLAAMGVVGILEWPVVAAVGVGSYVAERFAKSDIAKGRPGQQAHG
jgi:hypothetical protein